MRSRVGFSFFPKRYCVKLSTEECLTQLLLIRFRFSILFHRFLNVSSLPLGNIPRPRNYWWKVSDPMKLGTTWEKHPDLLSHSRLKVSFYLLTCPILWTPGKIGPKRSSFIPQLDFYEITRKLGFSFPQFVNLSIQLLFNCLKFINF